VHVGAGCFANQTSTFLRDGSVHRDAEIYGGGMLPTDLPGGADEAIASIGAPLFETRDLRRAVESFLADGPGKATFDGS